MSYLVVGDNPPLLLAHNAVFLLFSDQNHLNSLEKILLADNLSAMLHGVDSSLVDHVGKIRSHCAGCGKGDCLQINTFVHPNVFCVYLQDINSSFQVRLIHDNAAVKTSRTQKRRIENFRAVCRCKNEQPLVCIKSVHLRQELIEGLLPLIIASHHTVTGLSDGIDLINKYNTWRLLLSLFEKVSYTRCADTYIHFHKSGT